MGQSSYVYNPNVRPDVSNVRPDVTNVRPDVSNVRPDVSNVRPDVSNECLIPNLVLKIFELLHVISKN